VKKLQREQKKTLVVHAKNDRGSKKDDQVILNRGRQNISQIHGAEKRGGKSLAKLNAKTIFTKNKKVSHELSRQRTSTKRDEQ